MKKKNSVIELMGKESRYLNFIAYLQIIGIILVVFGHSFHEYPDGNNGTGMLIYRLFYSFRMPLFLFVSGFLMVYTTFLSGKELIRPKNFVGAKIRRLLLPMIVLTAITFVPRVFFSFAADNEISLTFSSFANSLLDSSHILIPYYWFLHVSFILLSVCFSIMFFGNKIGLPPKYVILGLFTLLLIYSLSSLPDTTFLSIRELKRLGLFFALGGVYAFYYRKVDNIIPWGNISFFILAGLIWAASFFLFENSSLWYVCSCFGIIMCISLCKILDKNNWRFLDHLKGANYLIFLLSWYCNVATQQVLAYYLTLPWWIYTLLSLISGVYVPWMAYKYLERHQQSNWIRFTSLLLGQSFKAHKTEMRTNRPSLNLEES